VGDWEGEKRKRGEKVGFVRWVVEWRRREGGREGAGKEEGKEGHTLFWWQRYGCEAATGVSSAYCVTWGPLLLLLQKGQGCGTGRNGQAALKEEEEGQEQFRRASSSFWRRRPQDWW